MSQNFKVGDRVGYTLRLWQKDYFEYEVVAVGKRHIIISEVGDESGEERIALLADIDFFDQIEQ